MPFLTNRHDVQCQAATQLIGQDFCGDQDAACRLRRLGGVVVRRDAAVGTSPGPPALRYQEACPS